MPNAKAMQKLKIVCAVKGRSGLYVPVSLLLFQLQNKLGSLNWLPNFYCLKLATDI